MKAFIARYRRPAGAHRANRPGPFPVTPAVDPWAGYPLFVGHAARRRVGRQ